MVELTLKWEKFALYRGLHSMMESEELVDVTIMCQGQFLQAHKNVLAAGSQQFRKIFKAAPDKNPIIVLKGVNVDHFKSLLQFMYLGEVTVSQDDLTEFIATADELGISALSKNAKNTDTSRRPPVPPEVVPEVEINPHSATTSRTSRRANRHPTSAKLPSDDKNETALQMECEEIETLMIKEEIDNDDWSGTPQVDHLDNNSESTPHHPVIHPVEEFYFDDKSSGLDDPGPSTSQGGETWPDAPPSGLHRTSRQIKRKAPHSPSPNFDSDDDEPQQSDDTTPQGFRGYPENKETFVACSKYQNNFDNSTKNITSFKCRFCPLIFESQELETNHLKDAHSQGPVTCDICQKVFKDIQSYYSHSSFCGNGPQVVLQHLCEICETSYAFQSDLIRHVRNYHGDLAIPHECHICHKMYKNQQALRVHVTRMHKKLN